jgi:hypothetical protein
MTGGCASGRKTAPLGFLQRDEKRSLWTLHCARAPPRRTRNGRAVRLVRGADVEKVRCEAALFSRHERSWCSSAFADMSWKDRCSTRAGKALLGSAREARARCFSIRRSQKDYCFLGEGRQKGYFCGLRRRLLRADYLLLNITG